MSKYLNSIKRLINLQGNDDYSLVTYTQTINPSNPLDVTNVSITDSILSYKGHFSESEINDTTIKSTDIKLYVDPSTISTIPNINNKIINGNTTYNIQNVKIYKSKDTVALYILQLRS